METDLRLLDELLQIAEDPHASVNRFLARLRAEPELTPDLLRVANSPLYGMQGKIVRLERVVLILGLPATIAILASLLVTRAVGARDHWLHAVETAHCARILSSYLGLGSENRAYLAGLVHDLDFRGPDDPTLARLVEAAHAIVEPGHGTESQPLADLGLDACDCREIRARLEPEIKETVRLLGPSRA